MGIIKKTALMVAGALALGLGLGLADPSNTRLMPSLLEHFAGLLGVASKPVVDKQAMHGAIVQFNRQLSAAYLALEPVALVAEPMADSLRQDYVAEIAFLKRQGRALEQTVQDIRIEEVPRFIVSSAPNKTRACSLTVTSPLSFLLPTDRLLCYSKTNSGNELQNRVQIMRAGTKKRRNMDRSGAFTADFL